MYVTVYKNVKRIDEVKLLTFKLNRQVLAWLMDQSHFLSKLIQVLLGMSEHLLWNVYSDEMVDIRQSFKSNSTTPNPYFQHTFALTIGQYHLCTYLIETLLIWPFISQNLRSAINFLGHTFD